MKRPGGTAIPRTTAKELGVPMQIQCSADAARIQDRVARARRLGQQDRVSRHGDAHIVKNGRGTSYTVWRDQESCSCPAGRNGMHCYHRVAVEIYEARRRAAQADTQEMPKNSLRDIRVSQVRLDRLADKLGV